MEEQATKTRYVWPVDFEKRLVLADAVAQIEHAVARAREVVEMADGDWARFVQIMTGVTCAEVGAGQMRKALQGCDDGDGDDTA